MPILGLPGPVLGRVCIVKSPIGIHTPFVRCSRLTVLIVLTKRQQILILKNSQVVLTQFLEISTNK